MRWLLGLCGAVSLMAAAATAVAEEPTPGRGDRDASEPDASEPAPSERAPSEHAPSEPASSSAEPSTPPVASPKLVARVEEAQPDEPEGDAPPKRAMVDYDGRGDDPTDAGDVLVWVPRILFSPLWVVTELVLRRPLSVIIPALEKTGLKEFLAEESDYLIFPTIVADFGFRPSIGVYFGINNLWFAGHQFRARASFGGVGFYKVKVKDRIVFDKGRQRFGLFGQFRQRADDTFGGIGPDIDYDRDTIGRFTTRFIEGGVRYDFGLNSPTSIELDASVRDVQFAADSCCGPPLFEQIGRGEVPRPDGLDGYISARPRLIAALDTRAKLKSREPWARLEVQLGADISLERPDTQRWATYGAELGAGIGLWHSSRRLQLSVATQFVDPLADEAVPFNALVRLGGDRYMRGFGGDALYGRSATVATLKYTWPIWVYLDGILHASTGNVFGEHLEDFDPEKLRMSFGLGIGTSIFDEDKLFELTFALGTDTVEQGAAVSSGRIAFGITDGF